MNTIRSGYVAAASILTATPAHAAGADFGAHAIDAAVSAILWAPLLTVTLVLVGVLVLLIALQSRPRAAPARRTAPAHSPLLTLARTWPAARAMAASQALGARRSR
jgi:hypothetical protein